MKRILIFTVILSLIFCAFGCKSENTDDVALPDGSTEAVIGGADEPTDIVVTPESQTPTPEPEPEKDPEPSVPNTPAQNDTPAAPSEPEKKAPDYKSYSCRSESEITWQALRFKNASTEVEIQLDFPSDWTLQNAGSGNYSITRGGKNIGSVSTSKPASPEGSFDADNSYDKEKQVVRFSSVSWVIEDGQDKVYRTYEFISDLGSYTLYINVDYTELSDGASQKLINGVLTVPKVIGAPFVPLSSTNGSKKILILGNSFIGTSKIGDFLADMLTGSGYSVEAVSRGHATVTTYTSDAQMMQAIRQGNYCYVFQCGFYGASENIEALKTVKTACEASKTKLVIFPAHNEPQGNATNATLAYPDLIFLDWKTELDDLIDMGIPKDDLRMNDSYGHSTPIAGYVGAHMIYRNLFEKLPPELTSKSPVSMTIIKDILGDYVTKISGTKPAPVSFNGSVYTL